MPAASLMATVKRDLIESKETYTETCFKSDGVSELSRRRSAATSRGLGLCPKKNRPKIKSQKSVPLYILSKVTIERTLSGVCQKKTKKILGPLYIVRADFGESVPVSSPIIRVTV